MKKHKKLICTFIIITALLIALPFIYSSFILKADPEGMLVENVTVNDEYISISGTNHGGLVNYEGYETRYDDGVLYVKYKVGLQFAWSRKTNSTSFYPIKNEYPDLKEIYITNDLHKKERLVWPEIQKNR